MTTTNSRRKGTAAESAVADYLKGLGWIYVERRGLRAGGRDEGDIAGIPGVVIEVKAERRMAVAEWVDEAEQEGQNAGADVAAVWHKRWGHPSPGEWYVTMTGAQFAAMLAEMGPVLASRSSLGDSEP